MTTTHASHTFYIGDDWEIEGTLFKADGTAYDLSVLDLQWELLRGSTVAIAYDLVVPAKKSPLSAGKIEIVVPRLTTATLARGKYVDRLRIRDTILDRVETMWTGEILVAR
jgi:hypothetical protein